MTDPTNLAHDTGGSGPTESGQSSDDVSDTVAVPRRVPPKFDFDTPDEESMQFIEDQWRKFCRSVGLQGQIPDIRAIAAARKTQSREPRRRSHWLLRPFLAVSHWFNDHP